MRTESIAGLYIFLRGELRVWCASGKKKKKKVMRSSEWYCAPVSEERISKLTDKVLYKGESDKGRLARRTDGRLHAGCPRGAFARDGPGTSSGKHRKPAAD